MDERGTRLLDGTGSRENERAAPLPESLATLYDCCSRQAFSLACAMLPDHRSAENAVEEAFLLAWSTRGTFDARRSSLDAWLLGIVHRCCRRALAAQGIQQEDARAGTGPSSEGPARSRIQRSLMRLPVLEREAIEMAYFRGMTPAQIAGALQLPLNVVNVRLREGLHRVYGALR